VHRRLNGPTSAFVDVNVTVKAKWGPFEQHLTDIQLAEAVIQFFPDRKLPLMHGVAALLNRKEGLVGHARDHYEASFLQHPENSGKSLGEMSHYNAVCDGCDSDPIRGVLYMCSEHLCNGGFYDLCETCYLRRLNLDHDNSHTFLRVPEDMKLFE